jgi:hypothetical protein
VGDLLQLETTWGNSNVIKSDDGMWRFCYLLCEGLPPFTIKIDLHA